MRSCWPEPSTTGVRSFEASSKATAGKSRTVSRRGEREIEKKSDKENVEVLVRSIYADLHRHAEEIDRLHARVGSKMGTETMWKIVGLVMTIGSTIGGLVGFLIHLMLKVKP